MPTRRVVDIKDYRRPTVTLRPKLAGFKEDIKTFDNGLGLARVKEISHRDRWMYDLKRHYPKEEVLYYFLFIYLMELGVSEEQIDHYIHHIDALEQRMRKSSRVLYAIGVSQPNKDIHTLTLNFRPFDAYRYNNDSTVEVVDLPISEPVNVEALVELLVEFHENRGMLKEPHKGSWYIQGKDGRQVKVTRNSVKKCLVSTYSPEPNNLMTVSHRYLDIYCEASLNSRFTYTPL